MAAKKPSLKLGPKRNSGQQNRELQALLEQGEIQNVPLELVDRDESQPRPLDEVMEGIDDFADELERDDFKLAQLPVFHIEDNGRYTIVIGERRTTAFRLKAQSTIPAVCKRFSDDEREKAFVLQYVENDGKLKKELSPLADARWWRAYADRFHGGKISEAAAARGRSTADISNRVALLGADQVIVDFVQRSGLKDPATYAALVRLCKRDGPDIVQTVINDYEEGQIKGSLRRYAEGLAREAKKTKKPNNKLAVHESASESGAIGGNVEPTPKQDNTPAPSHSDVNRENQGRSNSGAESILAAEESIKRARFTAQLLETLEDEYLDTRYNELLKLLHSAILQIESAQTFYKVERTLTKSRQSGGAVE